MSELNFSRLGTYDPTAGVHPFVEGFAAANRKATKLHERRVDDMQRLITDVHTGKEDSFYLRQAMRPNDAHALMHLLEKYPGVIGNAFDDGRSMAPLALRETMSITDYNALFVDVLDRMYYGYYSTEGVQNRALVKMHPLRDFRTVKRFMLDGVVTPMEKIKGPSVPPVQRSLTEEEPQITYFPDAYGALTSINWRAIVNDDLGIFNDVAQRLAISGNRAIQKFITGLYVDASGPHASLYTSGFTNQITTANGASLNNPPLGVQGIIDAFRVLAKMKDPTGDPIIFNGGLYLWYGPAYVGVAENLMNMLSFQASVDGGSANTQGFPTRFIEVNAWIKKGWTPILDRYIPIVCTTSGVQDTMWGLTYDPSAQNRPSLEMGFLRGFDTPQIYRKLPNTVPAGGGGADPTLGDFYTMDQDMKILSVWGGTQVDGRSTVASTGQGT